MDKRNKNRPCSPSVPCDCSRQTARPGLLKTFVFLRAVVHHSSIHSGGNEKKVFKHLAFNALSNLSLHKNVLWFKKCDYTIHAKCDCPCVILSKEHFCYFCTDNKVLFGCILKVQFSSGWIRCTSRQEHASGWWLDLKKMHLKTEWQMHEVSWNYTALYYWWYTIFVCQNSVMLFPLKLYLLKEDLNQSTVILRLRM